MKGKLFVALMISLALLRADGLNAQGMIEVKGSDSLQKIVERMAEVYMEENPGKYIVVKGGGSEPAINSIIKAKVDIANVSRKMTEKEIAKAEDNGVPLERFVVAFDSIGIITNANNSVDRLTLDQAGAIFRGEITNWSEVGGPKLPITLYGRQLSSGTYTYFRNTVVGGNYFYKMNYLRTSIDIIEAVKNDQTAIGYVSTGFVKEDSAGLNVVRIAKEIGTEYISPLNTSAVLSGKYPIVRALNQYVNRNLSKGVREFIAFELGPQGQRIVSETGFVPVPNQ